MNYLNAKKGIKKIIISQIFAMVTSVLMLCSSVYLVYFTKSLTANQDNTFVMYGVIAFGIAAVTFVMLALTALFEFFGFFQASKDEEEFKKSGFCAIASCLLTVTGMILQIPNGMLYTIFTSVGTIVEMFVMVFAVSGIINISQNLERKDMARRGDRLLKILLVIYILSSLNAVAIRIFELSSLEKTVSIIAMSFDAVLSVIRYIIYLRYLISSSKMLTESKTDDLEY